jgi:hypothetical protein
MVSVEKSIITKEVITLVNGSKEKKKYPVNAEMQKWLDYFDYSDKDMKVCLPNEIFQDLRNTICPTFGFSHKAFAYSFYYLSCYLYRNAKYGSIHPMRNLYSLQLIEFMYGDRKPINYITKRNGLLDLIGYTASENDFPITVEMENGEWAGFTMYQEQVEEVKKALNIPRNFICKKPLKAFKRNSDSKFLDGTFYEFPNCHWIDFPIFAKCMSSGTKGFELFYVYSFLFAFSDYINAKDKVYRSYLTTALDLYSKKTNQLLEKLCKLNLLRLESPTLLRYKIRESLNV